MVDMSFRLKIFLLCITVYILTLAVTCIVITESSYQGLLKTEINRCLGEQGSIYSTSVLYLITNLKQDEIRTGIESYGQRLVDMFRSEDTNIELLKENSEMIASSYAGSSPASRDELNEAAKGSRSYILRTIGEKHLLYISELIEVNGQKMLMTVIKDITHVDRQKANLYLFFMQFGIVGMVFVALITAVMSKYVTRRIEVLSGTAGKIASGSYGERVEISGNDEIAALARQFNTMAHEVERRIDELEKEGERKQRFIDNLTHELRTPLTSIIGYSDFLMSAKHDQAAFHKSLGYINSEGKRMLIMVNRLMEMILLRKNGVSIEKHNALNLLEETAGVMRAKAEEKEVSLAVEGQNLKVSLDWDMMKGVLINLVDNAINASKAGSSVTLGVSKEGQDTSIYVKDQGKGMGDSEICRVMEPFYRVDKSRSRRQGGLGLGLSICSEVVKAHQAELKIESKVGEGTVVRILFQNN